MKTRINTYNSVPLTEKYRPKNLKQFLGNDHVKVVLKSLFKNRRIGRTILISGQSGTGKTTLARIIARTLNCQKLDEYGKVCGSCKSCVSDISSHPDILEVVGAAINSTEETQKIISYSNSPAFYNFKVIIINEPLFIKQEFIQHLLPSFEKPNTTSVWILCTKSPEKLSKEVLSRFLKFYLDYPTKIELKHLLKKILKEENLKLYKRVKPYLDQIIINSGFHPRECLWTLENVINLYLTSKDKEQFKDSIKKVVNNYVNIDSKVIEFLNHIYSSNLDGAFKVINSIANGEADIFLQNSHKYSYYATAFILNGGKRPENIKPFYGLRLDAWESKLKSLKIVNSMIPFSVCQAITEVVSNCRYNSLIDSNQLLISVTYKSLLNVNNSRNIQYQLED